MIKSRVWWSSLSINEMKTLAKKYYPMFSDIDLYNMGDSWIDSIYEGEVNNTGWHYEQCRLSDIKDNLPYYEVDPRLSLAITPNYKHTDDNSDSIVWVVYYGSFHPYKRGE